MNRTTKNIPLIVQDHNFTYSSVIHVCLRKHCSKHMIFFLNITFLKYWLSCHNLTCGSSVYCNMHWFSVGLSPTWNHDSDPADKSWQGFHRCHVDFTKQNRKCLLALLSLVHCQVFSMWQTLSLGFTALYQSCHKLFLFFLCVCFYRSLWNSVWLQMARSETGSCFGEWKTVGVFFKKLFQWGFHDDNETKRHWRERRWRGEGIVKGVGWVLPRLMTHSWKGAEVEINGGGEEYRVGIGGATAGSWETFLHVDNHDESPTKTRRTGANGVSFVTAVWEFVIQFYTPASVTNDGKMFI